MQKILMIKNKGFALILAIFLLLFISIAFVALFYLFTTDLQIIDNHQMETQALYIAEAGIENVLANLREDKDWNTGSLGIATIFPKDQARPPIGIPTMMSGYSIIYPWQPEDEPNRIWSMGYLSSHGFSKTLVVKVSVKGDNAPYVVKVLDWDEI